jgi:hypothetical protein
LHITEDGGKTFVPQPHGYKHGDHHAMAFDPDDPEYLMYGTDGGVYESFDLGKTFRFVSNLPVTQFYKVAVDNDTPFYNVYGGTQDNNTQGGPSRTDNVHGILNSDWFITLFGDGHQPAVDPNDPNIVYSQWQQGNLVRYDRKTGEVIYIQPQPAAGEESERFNWDAPILISPHDPARIYFASQRLWRSDDRGDSWTAISGDLSHGRDRLMEPMMGRVWSFDASWDLWAMSLFGTITNVSESPLVEGLLYVGTDDGRIQISEDGGQNWRAIERLPDVPDDFFVNDIKADLHDPDTVYVVVDDHKSGDFSPYVLKSTNRGGTWTHISRGLPERHIVWRLVQDHVNPRLLFAGTEFGVFFTVDGGQNWVKLAGGAPTISFRDLVIQQRENDLVAASFGRGFWILDDYSPLRSVTREQLQNEATLFPVREADWYIPRVPMGDFEVGGKSSQGDSFFVAPNPPFGAVFTYYLSEDIRTAKEQRRESEKALEKSGGDTPYPGWEDLRKEEIEESPAIVLTVRDASGEIVRRIEGPIKAGFHRVAWDLRYPVSSPWTPEPAGESYIDIPGPLAAPGTYQVSMAKRINSEFQPIGMAQSFTVTPIGERGQPGAPAEEVVAFSRSLDDLNRQVAGASAAVEAMLVETGAIKETLLRSDASDNLRGQARTLELELLALKEKLSGNEIRDLYQDIGPVSISSRVNFAVMGTFRSTYGPTPSHRAAIDIAQKEFAEVSQRIQQIADSGLPELRAELNRAGVPWTPGRGVPGEG